MTLNEWPDVTDIALVYRKRTLLVARTSACLIAATDRHQAPILGVANRLRLNQRTTHLLTENLAPCGPLLSRRQIDVHPTLVPAHVEIRSSPAAYPGLHYSARTLVLTVNPSGLTERSSGRDSIVLGYHDVEMPIRNRLGSADSHMQSQFVFAEYFHMQRCLKNATEASFEDPGHYCASIVADYVLPPSTRASQTVLFRCDLHVSGSEFMSTAAPC